MNKFEALISGETRGVAASLARSALGVAGFVYGRVMAVRNAYYDTWAMPVWLDVPVISVGNLTVGGTGKTPMTIWLCERMLERGRKPAVLSRGYKATANGVADELLLVSRRVPQAVAVANADRVRAGRLAIEQYGVRAAILDDGFQHRRCGRDLDIVLVDATRPFGYGHILPGGLLRERISSVRRADAIIMTRADQADGGQTESVERTIREWNRHAPVVRAVHEPSGFFDLAGTPVDRPAAGRVGIFAGIARPEAFVRTLTDLGLPPAATMVFADHHAYSAADVERLAAWARDERLDCLVTTEKDAVKIESRGSGFGVRGSGPSTGSGRGDERGSERMREDEGRIGDREAGSEPIAHSSELAAWPVAVVSLGVRMKMLGDGDRVLGELIDRMLAEHEEGERPSTGSARGG